MSVSSPAPTVEKCTTQVNDAAVTAGRRLRFWLRIWGQVLIAELLHLMEPRKSFVMH